MTLRPTYLALSFAVVALAAVGCHSSSAAPAAPGSSSSAGSASSSAPASASGSAPPQYTQAYPTTFQTVTLNDPTFNMKAYDVTIPSGWKFQGVVSPGDNCKATPFPVFRAYSPDGLSEFRRLPNFDWGWSNNRVAQSVADTCPQINKTLSGTEFLHYLSGVMGYTYTADWPIPDADKAAYQATIKTANNNYVQYGMRGYSMTGDIGAARTEVNNGSFTVEQQLYVAIICTISPLPDGTTVNNCTAQTSAIRAPKGRLDELVKLIGGHGSTPNPAWQQALVQAQNMRTQQIMQQRAVAFQQWSNMMAQEHNQFMAQMNAEGAQRTANFNANMAAKSTSTSDWVDYALNQQTVSGDGSTAKVSSTAAATWTNGQGQWYQSPDPGANPNGVLSGTWTQGTVVHGNGQPK